VNAERDVERRWRPFDGLEVGLHPLVELHLRVEFLEASVVVTDLFTVEKGHVEVVEDVA